jgi:molybdate transport system substrate-binding protein
MNLFVHVSSLKTAFAAALLLVSAHSPAAAAEIALLCAGAMESAMKEIIPEFQRASNHTVKAAFANIGQVTERVRKGEQADLICVSPRQWEDLQKENKLAAAMRVVIAKVGIGVYVKKGAMKPNIASSDALKAALVGARGISIGDPADGSPTGAYAIGLFDRLGITAEVRPKLKLVRGATPLTDPVLKGEADIGLTQLSVIAADAGVDLVAPLPGDLQNFTVFTAGTPTNAKEPAAARALVDFVLSPRGVTILKSKGLDQG